MKRVGEPLIPDFPPKRPRVVPDRLVGLFQQFLTIFAPERFDFGRLPRDIGQLRERVQIGGGDSVARELRAFVERHWETADFDEEAGEEFLTALTEYERPKALSAKQEKLVGLYKKFLTIFDCKEFDFESLPRNIDEFREQVTEMGIPPLLFWCQWVEGKIEVMRYILSNFDKVAAEQLLKQLKETIAEFDLADELLLKIFHFLDIKDLARVSLVNKQFWRLCQDNSLPLVFGRLVRDVNAVLPDGDKLSLQDYHGEVLRLDGRHLLVRNLHLIQALALRMPRFKGFAFQCDKAMSRKGFANMLIATRPQELTMRGLQKGVIARIPAIESLRALHLEFAGSSTDMLQECEKKLRELQCLEELSISGANCRELVSAVGSLSHLRRFSWHAHSITPFTSNEQLGSLRHLRELRLTDLWLTILEQTETLAGNLSQMGELRKIDLGIRLIDGNCAALLASVFDHFPYLESCTLEVLIGEKGFVGQVVKNLLRAPRLRDLKITLGYDVEQPSIDEMEKALSQLKSRETAPSISFLKNSLGVF